MTIGVSIITCLPRLYKSSKTVKNRQKTFKTAKINIGVPIVAMVTCLPRLYQQCTKSVTIVKSSDKQSKDSQNSKNEALRLRV